MRSPGMELVWICDFGSIARCAFRSRAAAGAARTRERQSPNRQHVVRKRRVEGSQWRRRRTVDDATAGGEPGTVARTDEIGPVKSGYRARLVRTGRCERGERLIAGACDEEQPRRTPYQCGAANSRERRRRIDLHLHCGAIRRAVDRGELRNIARSSAAPASAARLRQRGEREA